MTMALGGVWARRICAGAKAVTIISDSVTMNRLDLHDIELEYAQRVAALSTGRLVIRLRYALGNAGKRI